MVPVLSRVTAAATAVLLPCGLRVNVEVVIEEPAIASEKAADRCVGKEWTSRRSPGDYDVKVGTVVSPGPPVVKVKVLSVANGLPARSVTPAVPPLIVAV